MSAQVAAPHTAAEVVAQPAIEARKVSFAYGRHHALSDVSFTIQRAEIFGILGPNGGGKTTLFKLLSTLVPLQQGSINMLGCDLAGKPDAVRHRIGVVFQHPGIDGKLTVAENLLHHGRLFGMHGARLRERIAEVLAGLSLSSRRDDLAETLSGGLRRRAELAKALLHQPTLLLMDEPSSGLDPAARREFNEHLAYLRERDGVTIVLTTHYMEEAERCDRIAMLDSGKLVAIAPPGRLKGEIGGDVVVIRANGPETLAERIAQRFDFRPALVDGALRVEHPRGHELVRDLVEAFGAEIESISFGRPTLEDVFVHLTGKRFFHSGNHTRE